jgi:REP element-mobilizing transposase RayT
VSYTLEPGGIVNLELGKYYHLYNRSNNEEIVFRADENYVYFLKKYRSYLQNFVNTIAYCLMPTHFHFVVRVTTTDESALQKSIGLLLSSYTKAINKRYHRHGGLFQPHTKAKEILDKRYLLTVISYIHQNPIRAKKAVKLEGWPYSSYCDIVGMRSGTLPDKDFYRKYFKSEVEFKKYSEKIVAGIKIQDTLKVPYILILLSFFSGYISP